MCQPERLGARSWFVDQNEAIVLQSLTRHRVILLPPNALTLSCKSRSPRRPRESGTAAAATNTQWQERTAADVTRACSSEPPEAARRRAKARRLLSACEGS